MPYAKTSIGYPLEMRTAVERVTDMNLPLVVECGTERKARSLRGRYYQYLAACKRDADKPPSIWSELEHESHKRFLRALYTVEFAVEGTQFVIRPRDKSPLATMLASAELLYEEGKGVPASEQSGTLGKEEASLLERLLVVQEKSKKGE